MSSSISHLRIVDSPDIAPAGDGTSSGLIDIQRLAAPTSAGGIANHITGDGVVLRVHAVDGCSRSRIVG